MLNFLTFQKKTDIIQKMNRLQNQLKTLTIKLNQACQSLKLIKK